MANNDETVVNELVTGLMSWVIKIIDYWVPENFEYLLEDLYSEANYQLVLCVNNCLGKSFDVGQFLFYVKRAILDKVMDWAMENSVTISIESRSRRRHQPDIEQCEIREWHLWTDTVFADIEFDDFIHTLFDGKELNAIKMMSNGWTREEVELELELTPLQFDFIRLKVRDKLETL